MRLIIAGTRDFEDYGLLEQEVDKFLEMHQKKDEPLTIISGAARGADSLGERYARENGWSVKRFPADWKRHGRSAGHRRNAEMTSDATHCLVFWDGKSRGSKGMIAMSDKARLVTHVVIYQYEGEK